MSPACAWKHAVPLGAGLSHSAFRELVFAFPGSRPAFRTADTAEVSRMGKRIEAAYHNVLFGQPRERSGDTLSRNGPDLMSVDCLG